jgi:hypothetical protein
MSRIKELMDTDWPGEHCVALLDDDPEIVFHGSADDAIEFARAWLHEPLGCAVAIVPPSTG